MIPPHLSQFMDSHPDLEVDVILDDRVVDLISEGIDVALRMGELADWSAVAPKLETGRRLVIATPANLERHGVLVIPADLAAHWAVVYRLSPRRRLIRSRKSSGNARALVRAGGSQTGSGKVGSSSKRGMT